MKNNGFNPEKKIEEWQNRPAKLRLKKKRRFSALLFILNIAVIVLAYMIMTKNRDLPGYYSSAAEYEKIEYRLSLADNNETRTFGITLTIRNAGGKSLIFNPSNDISEIFINHQGEMITSLSIINSTGIIKFDDKPLVFNSRLNKEIIDGYLEEKGLLKNKKKSFLNFKRNLYSIDALLYINNRTVPLKVTFDHEAAR